MARDTGRYDAITQTWIDQQERVDFAWGNVPLQSNLDRGTNVLDPVLDSHEIAYLGWNGFPEFVPNTTGGNSGSGSGGSGAGVTYVEVPQIPMPSSFEQYAAQLTALGLVALDAAPVENTIGSNLNGQVTVVDPAPGTSVAVGSTIIVREYAEYVAPPVLGPTTDWFFDGMSGYFRFPEMALPSALTSAPAGSFKIVVTGGNLAGEYIVSQANFDNMFQFELVRGFTRPNSYSYYRGVGLADNPNYSSNTEDAGIVSIEPYVQPAFLGTERTNWYLQSGSLYVKDLFALPTQLEGSSKNAHLLIISGGLADGVYPLSATDVEYYSMGQAVRVYNNSTNTSSGTGWWGFMNGLKGSTYTQDSMNMMLADAGVVKFVVLEEVQVPNLVGMTGSQAIAALEALGLGTTQTDTILGTTPSNVGTVASQAQAPATTVYKGSKVTFTVYANTMTINLSPGNPYLIDMGNGPELRLANYSVTSTSPAYLAAANNGLMGKTITFSGDLTATDNAMMPVSTGSITQLPFPIIGSSTSYMMGPEATIRIAASLIVPTGSGSTQIVSGTATIS